MYIKGIISVKVTCSNMLQNDLIDMINLRRAFDGSRNSSFFSTLIIENSAKDPFNSTFA